MTNIRKISLFLLILSMSCPELWSQDATHFPLSRDAAREQALVDAITARYNNDLTSLTGEHKKQISEIYKQRYEMIREHFTENEIITDKKTADYLAALTDRILKANPSLHITGTRVVFSRAWWPNASSMGEGTILFNIGLFNRLDNESEAVFVLCHELAHYYLNHSNNKIEKYVEQVNSKEFQKQLKTIQKSEFRQNQQLEELLKSFSFSTMRHSRDNEEAADSMALELMKPTGFDLKGALTCLGKLDSSDRDKFSTVLNLEQHFNFSAFPFKKSWIESDALAFVASKATDKEKAEVDSLKTHPDCQKRIRKLQNAVEQFNKPSNHTFLVNENLFHELTGRFDYDVLDFCFDQKRVSKCLFYALKMSEQYPADAYLHTMVGKCLNEIYSKQKEHQLGTIVDLPGPDYSDDYNNLLHLIQNTRLYEIASLSYYYLFQYRAQFEKDKLFSSAWEKSLENFTKQ